MSIIAPIVFGASTAGALDPLPTVTPLPTITVPPVPQPNPNPAPASDPGDSPAPAPTAPSGGSSGGTGTTDVSSTDSSVSSSESSGGATRTKAISTTKIAPASKLVGEGEGGCDPSPSNALLGQLAQEYAAPPVVLSEPPGMEGPQTNNRLLPILRRAHERRGFSLRQGFLKVAGPFPVAGPASWSDDWHAYRACPYPHLHEGLDIFAHWGTPVVAVSRGVLTQKGISSMSGLYIQITNRHGFQFFYDHFSRFARGLRLGQRIHLGQVVGYVGTTGNAQGTSPHLHLEVQPGGTPTPPKPFVDRWLLSALRQARALASGRPTPRSSFPTRSYSR